MAAREKVKTNSPIGQRKEGKTHGVRVSDEQWKVWCYAANLIGVSVNKFVNGACDHVASACIGIMEGTEEDESDEEHDICDLYRRSAGQLIGKNA